MRGLIERKSILHSATGLGNGSGVSSKRVALRRILLIPPGGKEYLSNSIPIFQFLDNKPASKQGSKQATPSMSIRAGCNHVQQ